MPKNARVARASARSKMPNATICRSSVLQGRQSQACDIRGYQVDISWRLSAYHPIIGDAEGAGSGQGAAGRGRGIELVVVGVITAGRSCRIELISAFATAAAVGREIVVDKASCGGGGDAGFCPAERGHRCRVPNRRICGGVSNFTNLDRVKALGGGRIIGRHAGTHEVRNRYCRDHQDNRDYDQHFDQRKSPKFASAGHCCQSLLAQKIVALYQPKCVGDVVTRVTAQTVKFKSWKS